MPTSREHFSPPRLPERRPGIPLLTPLLCLLTGHRWLSWSGMRLPAGTDWYVGSLAGSTLSCERCGKRRAAR